MSLFACQGIPLIFAAEGVNTRATIHAKAIQTDRVRETNHCKTVVAKYLCSLHSAKAFVRQFTSSNYLLT